jgi:hypothetical protein
MRPTEVPSAVFPVCASRSWTILLVPPLFVQPDGEVGGDRGKDPLLTRLGKQRVRVAQSLHREYAETKAEAYLSLGEVLRLAGRLEEARAALESARAIFETKGFELSADAARAKLAELSGGALPAS